MPLRFAFLYDGQGFFEWSDCLLDLGTDFFVGDMVFVRDNTSIKNAWDNTVIKKEEEGLFRLLVTKNQNQNARGSK